MLIGLAFRDLRVPLGFVLVTVAIWMTASAWSQGLEERAPREPSFQEKLDFTEPTVIRGRLRMVDRDEGAIWLDWEQRLEERSMFPKGWTSIKDGSILLLYPRDRNQFRALDRLPTGTALEMVVQLTDDDRRRILSFKNLDESSGLPFDPKGH